MIFPLSFPLSVLPTNINWYSHKSRRRIRQPIAHTYDLSPREQLQEPPSVIEDRVLPTPYPSTGFERERGDLGDGRTRRTRHFELSSFTDCAGAWGLGKGQSRIARDMIESGVRC
jgi:hypothetical protein